MSTIALNTLVQYLLLKLALIILLIITLDTCECHSTFAGESFI